MPRLKDQSIERNKRKIEQAAMRMFIKQGYHGTSLRDIAKACKVSVGNIYNYYPTKEKLFSAIVASYEAKMEGLRAEALGPLDNVFDPDGLKQLAAAVQKIVYGNPDYWRLMYIDVVEFGNRHFAGSFRGLARNMEARLGDRLRQAAAKGAWNGIDPALAFTAVYLQFFTYFLVEKLFGGKEHLGMPDDQAIGQLIQIASHGLRGNPAAPRRAKQGAS
jgi:AcrR family transcriptional regulator